MTDLWTCLSELSHLACPEDHCAQWTEVFLSCRNTMRIYIDNIRDHRQRENLVKHIKMLPAHFETAYIRVKIQQRPYAYRKSHYFVKLRPFGWVQIEHVKDELPQFRAVAV